jgi:hypothetical protein
MALEYVLYAAADLTTEEFLAFLAETLNAPIFYNFVSCDGLQITAYREDPGEEAFSAEEFGFPHRLTATFQFANLAPRQLRDENTVLMVSTTLTFLNRYSSSGVLLFNGERVVLQKLNGQVELDRDWEEDWTLPGMDTVIAGLSQRPLPQPFL